jgi:hypothetical protein
MVDWLSIVGNGAFALGALSLFARDILLLRVISVASGIASLTYNYFIPGGPIWLPLGWVSFFILINVVQILIVLRERRPHPLTEEEAELHEAVFPTFSIVEFRKLLRLGAWRDMPLGTVLGIQGENPSEIIIVAHGRCDVERDGRVVRTLNDGAMIGELALITDTPFRATIKAATDLRCLVWPKPVLARFFSRNPLIALAMESAFIRTVAADWNTAYRAAPEI